MKPDKTIAKFFVDLLADCALAPWHPQKPVSLHGAMIKLTAHDLQ